VHRLLCMIRKVSGTQILSSSVRKAFLGGHEVYTPLVLFVLKGARLVILSSLLIILVVQTFPFAAPTRTNADLKSGMYWSLSGINTYAATGTGTYGGTLREENSWTETFEIERVDGQTIRIRRVTSGSWVVALSGWFEKWWGNDDRDGSYSNVYRYEIDGPSGRYITGVSESYKNKPSWFIVNPSKIGSGGQSFSQYRWDEKGKAEEVFYRVSEKTASVKDIEVTAWEASYSGATIGYWEFIKGKRQTGTESDSLLFDRDFGFLIGRSGKGTYTYHAASGTISETFERESSFQDSNAWVVASFDAEPRTVAVTVDGKAHSANELPKSFLWTTGSSHTFNVEAAVSGNSGVRYVFIQWSDGTKDLSRTLTSSYGETYKATYTTQYELQVASQRGDPQGSGWYDEGSSATFSVTTPLTVEGFMGTLGGKYVFDHWSGDSTATTAAASVAMDGPKIVRAEWRTDNSMPYMIVFGIVIAIVVMLTVLLLVRRRRARFPVSSYMSPLPISAAPPPPPPGPTMMPPAQRFCMSCGAPLPASMRFCNRCGARQ